VAWPTTPGIVCVCAWRMMVEGLQVHNMCSAAQLLLFGNVIRGLGVAGPRSELVWWAPAQYCNACRSFMCHVSL
jgi:hypothetical protein